MLNRIASEILKIARELKAIDFHTKDEFDKYMRDHPDADRSHHRLIETKKPSNKKELSKRDVGNILQNAVTHARNKQELKNWSVSSEFGGYDVGKSIKKYIDQYGEKALWDDIKDRVNLSKDQVQAVLKKEKPGNWGR